MKATNKVIAAVGVIGIIGLIIYVRQRHKKNLVNEQVSQEVADHGYETAHDILFPQKKRVQKYKYRPA